MDPNILTLIKEIGPLGAIALILVLHYVNEAKYVRNRKEHEEETKIYYQQIAIFQKTLDDLSTKVQTILLANENKVSFNFLREELKNYSRTDVANVITDGLTTSLVRLHERVDHVEGRGK